jgi:hypothetical protein
VSFESEVGARGIRGDAKGWSTAHNCTSSLRAMLHDGGLQLPAMRVVQACCRLSTRDASDYEKNLFRMWRLRTS